jgi:hypothetical protein
MTIVRGPTTGFYSYGPSFYGYASGWLGNGSAWYARGYGTGLYGRRW